MDPVSAAGIGLAVGSLASQGLAGAMKAIQLISDARNLESDYTYLNTRLRLEQLRLYSWSSEAGLLKRAEARDFASNPSHWRLNDSGTVDTLVQIQGLAIDFIKGRGRHRWLVPDEDDPHLSQTRPIGQLTEQITDVTRFWRKSRRLKHNSIGLPRQLKWAVFYKDKFETFINKVRELNDVLLDLVGSDARAAICRSVQENSIAMLHMHDRVEELTHLVKALASDVAIKDANTWSRYGELCSSQCPSGLASLASFKAFNISLDDEAFCDVNKSLESSNAIKDQKLARSHIHMLDTAHDTFDRCEAYLDRSNGPRQRVWVEWRDYHPAAQLEVHMDSRIPTRIQKLVALLSDPRKPSLLRVPHCLGYFEDSTGIDIGPGKARLGLVMGMPGTISTSPISLRHLIETQTKPLLTKRITLTKAIAYSIVSLHSVKWLHKGLRSHNVVFFPEDNRTIDYSSPYLSGFGYARPDHREDMTEVPSRNPIYDMYKHPLVQGFGPYEGRQSFKRTFDIYSLGVVLFEIANWKTIDQLLKIQNPHLADMNTLNAIQKRLLEESMLMDSVGSNAGLRYLNVTRNCLMGAEAFGVGSWDDETDVHITAKLSKNFLKNVLRPLEDINT